MKDPYILGCCYPGVNVNRPLTTTAGSLATGRNVFGGLDDPGPRAGGPMLASQPDLPGTCLL